MTQAQNENLLAGFTYADPTAPGNYLSQVKLEENKPVLLAFLQNVPRMQAPPIVECRVHWNTEMGEKGMKYQCFGGQCCEQITWQKGYGGQPGKFAPNKASKRYYVPCVVYEPDPTNQTQMKATVKYMDMSWTAFNSFGIAMTNTTEGFPFWERDIVVTAKKVNGAIDYVFDKKESQAQWIVNPVFNKQVQEQLPTVAERLLVSLPKAMTEAEFMAMKPELDAKVQSAMATHGNPQAVQQTPQAQFGSLPQGFAQPFAQTVQQFTQPQVNIPIQPQTVQQFTPVQQVPTPEVPQHPFEQVQPQTVQQFTQPQVNIPVPTPVVENVSQTITETPQVVNPTPVVEITPVADTTEKGGTDSNVSLSLDFDPSTLLK